MVRGPQAPAVRLAAGVPGFQRWLSLDQPSLRFEQQSTTERLRTGPRRAQPLAELARPLPARCVCGPQALAYRVEGELAWCAERRQRAAHPRIFAKHQTITAPEHARALRALRGAPPEAEVETRPLERYDRLIPT